MVAVPTELLEKLAQKTDSKIVLLVCDGLGGLPHPETGLTELETARTPNLDALARKSNLGYADSEIRDALRQLPPVDDAASLLRDALKLLGARRAG